MLVGRYRIAEELFAKETTFSFVCSSVTMQHNHLPNRPLQCPQNGIIHVVQDFGKPVLSICFEWTFTQTQVIQSNVPKTKEGQHSHGVDTGTVGNPVQGKGGGDWDVVVRVGEDEVDN